MITAASARQQTIEQWALTNYRVRRAELCDYWSVSGQSVEGYGLDKAACLSDDWLLYKPPLLQALLLVNLQLTTEYRQCVLAASIEFVYLLHLAHLWTALILWSQSGEWHKFYHFIVVLLSV